MGELIDMANVSLDGSIEDPHGSLQWTAPTDEVFSFITDVVRPVGTYLSGRRPVRDDGGGADPRSTRVRRRTGR